MFEDTMDDVEIMIAIRKELDASKNARTDVDADPSLYAPWGKLGPEDYAAGRHFRVNKPN